MNTPTTGAVSGTTSAIQPPISNATAEKAFDPFLRYEHVMEHAGMMAENSAALSTVFNRGAALVALGLLGWAVYAHEPRTAAVAMALGATHGAVAANSRRREKEFEAIKLAQVNRIAALDLHCETAPMAPPAAIHLAPAQTIAIGSVRAQSAQERQYKHTALTLDFAGLALLTAPIVPLPVTLALAAGAGLAGLRWWQHYRNSIKPAETLGNQQCQDFTRAGGCQLLRYHYPPHAKITHGI